MSEKKEEPIIFKKIKKAGHGGHHGGAWKVAYADFVTAMMAFFLVMWIMGLSESSRKAIASYFDKPGAFNFATGKSLPVGLSTTMPAQYSDIASPNRRNNFTDRYTPPDVERKLATMDSAKQVQFMQAVKDSVAAATELQHKQDEFKKKIEESVKQSPNLEDLSSSIKVELSKEGLRIELLETRESVFFEVGSARMKKEAVQLLHSLSGELGKLPNNIQVEGHTDSRPYGNNAGGYTNWELSTDRANAARRVLDENGLWTGQISKVTGFADRNLRDKENPFDISNRRISILVEYMKTDNFMGEKSK